MLKKDERKKKIKKFKSLASAHIGKIAILLVISTLSSTILCSCGDDKNSTQSSTTQSTTQSTKPTTEQGHVHTWTTETYYTTETQVIERAGYMCDDGTFFENGVDAARYADEHLLGYCSGVKRETVTVQVPHTTTVVDKPAWDEKVEVQVPHTRNVCKCGATK